MINRFLPVLVASMLAVTLTPLSTTIAASESTARIPFNFTANGKSLAPGVYTVSNHGSTLLIRSASGGAFMISVPTDARKRLPPSLVFEKTGDRYVLREVWMGGSTGYQLPRGKVAPAPRIATSEPVVRVEVPLT